MVIAIKFLFESLFSRKGRKIRKNTDVLKNYKILIIMTQDGSPYDNAVAESVFF